MSLDTLLGIAGFALGVIGLIAGYVFYRKGMKIKEPIYSVKSNNVISGYSSKYKNLTVSYKGKKVENFTVSKVLFYNNGTETITRQDIATLNQIRILIHDGKIMDATVLQANNLSSDFNVSLDKANALVNIDFDYLNQNHGAVIEVIHTGLSSAGMEIVGDIKGVQKLSQVPLKQLGADVHLTSTEKRWLGISVLISLGGVFILPFLRGYDNSLEKAGNSWLGILIALPLIVAVAFSSLFILFVIVFYIQNLFTIRKKLPKGLEKFNEE